MEITIDKKTYVCRFGVGFVRKLNEKAGVEVSGLNMNMALQKTLPALSQGDPAALADTLFAATQNKANTKRPTQADIDDYLDGDADIDALVDTAIAEIKESNATKRAAAKMLAQ